MSKPKEEKKKGLWTLLGAAAGGIAGYFLGNPVLGAQIGASIGSRADNRGGGDDGAGGDDIPRDADGSVDWSALSTSAGKEVWKWIKDNKGDAAASAFLAWQAKNQYEMQQRGIAAAKESWEGRKPLREAGVAGVMDPAKWSAANETLPDLSGIGYYDKGNPYARPRATPGATPGATPDQLPQNGPPKVTPLDIPGPSTAGPLTALPHEPTPFDFGQINPDNPNFFPPSPGHPRPGDAPLGLGPQGASPGMAGGVAGGVTPIENAGPMPGGQGAPQGSPQGATTPTVTAFPGGPTPDEDAGAGAAPRSMRGGMTAAQRRLLAALQR